MKKIIALFLALLMVLSLCACGGTNGGTKAAKNPVLNITFEDGTTEKMTLSELKEVKENNIVAFEKKYRDAKVKFTSFVEDINYDYHLVVYDDSHHFDSITFIDTFDGIELRLHHGDHDDTILELNKESMVEVESKIVGWGDFCLVLSDIKDESGHLCEDLSKMTIVQK